MPKFQIDPERVQAAGSALMSTTQQLSEVVALLCLTWSQAAEATGRTDVDSAIRRFAGALEKSLLGLANELHTIAAHIQLAGFQYRETDNYLAVSAAKAIRADPGSTQ